jgi:hypothetical protein
MITQDRHKTSTRLLGNSSLKFQAVKPSSSPIGFRSIILKVSSMYTCSIKIIIKKVHMARGRPRDVDLGIAHVQRSKYC